MPVAQSRNGEMLESRIQADEPEDPLDSRIENELDKMNTSAFLINKLENDLRNAQKKFKALYDDCMVKLNSSATKIWQHIHKAMPYYDCRIKAKEAQEALRETRSKCERAVSEKYTAREMVEVAEQGYDAEKAKCNMAWQEMLNHATNKLLVAEATTLSCEVNLQRATQFLNQCQRDVQRQHKLNKRAVSKSKSYFEMKSKFHQILEQQRNVITKIEVDFSSAKSLYAKSMSNLETISEEIHTRRQNRANTRSPQINAHLIVPADNNNTLSKGMAEVEHKFNDVTGDCVDIASSPPVSNISTLSQATTSGGSGYSSSMSSETSPTQSLTRSLTHSTKAESDEECVKEGCSMNSLIKKRSSSCREFSASPPSTLSKPRSMSIPASPLYLPDGYLDTDGTLSRSDSSILDDECIDDAVSQKYFDTESYNQTEVVISVCEKALEHEEVDILPSKLAVYQKQFTLKRRSSYLSSDGRSLVVSSAGHTSTVELGNILHLIDNELEEYEV